MSGPGRIALLTMLAAAAGENHVHGRGDDSCVVASDKAGGTIVRDVP